LVTVVSVDGAGVESQICGASKLISGGSEEPAAAIRSPEASVDSTSPSVLTVSCSEDSAGLAAAVASCTTSTSENPPWVSAVTTRSTPA
jgi:hypothetical protein